MPEQEVKPEVKEILQIIDRLRADLLKCKLKTSTIAIKVSRLEAAASHELERLKIWLQVLDEVYLKAYRDAYDLVTPAQWKSYQDLGIDNLAEQEILNGAMKDVRDKWFDRPNIINRSKSYKPDVDGKHVKTGKQKRTERRNQKARREA